MSARFCTSAAVAAALFLITAADARPWRPAQVPNGTEIGCALCHVNPAGGGARNAFGQMVAGGFLSGGNVVWGPELAALDADGDGASNGAELLDPEGTWTVGDPNPGDASQLTLPYDAASAPPPAATAVASTSWARLKAIVAELER